MMFTIQISDNVKNSPFPHLFLGSDADLTEGVLTAKAVGIAGPDEMFCDILLGRGAASAIFNQVALKPYKRWTFLTSRNKKQKKEPGTFIQTSSHTLSVNSCLILIGSPVKWKVMCVSALYISENYLSYNGFDVGNPPAEWLQFISPGVNL